MLESSSIPANDRRDRHHAAQALPGPGTTIVSARGDDPDGGSALTYAWSVATEALAAVAFSANGTHAARKATATFIRPGSYALRVTIGNRAVNSVASEVVVTVAGP
jgi:hypothetical protein